MGTMKSITRRVRKKFETKANESFLRVPVIEGGTLVKAILLHVPPQVTEFQIMDARFNIIITDYLPYPDIDNLQIQYRFDGIVPELQINLLSLNEIPDGMFDAVFTFVY